MMLRALKILIVGLATCVFSVSSVAAAGTEHTPNYQWLIGTGGTAPPLGPDITRDPANGHVLLVTGKGTFTRGVESSVTGGGNFVVTDAAAHLLASGTWTATGLDSFTSFGTTSPFPEDFEGGLAKLDIAIHPAGTTKTFTGSLQIHCAINNTSSIEGVTSFVEMFEEEFTQPVFGETLFINQDSDPAPG
jgi:hypothetical protein